ncbi:hypothetical protein HanPSC8_Chr06g0259171 [Helianthus annuus]|nr:hypothetical protein HanIR_Chr06g0288911 [Helianthus annuus]KAJ0574255.1 hypothetical protein HanHA89_Chr06g0236091 [Helianthus annuus]KAJ0738590.1 hypothetical protein HanLR1_Chr06g0220021 [Helianthus annuus]KAJ0916220.1 hypothetical protein HanPSC8_Chr06g0259171 [Helianthus annuus]
MEEGVGLREPILKVYKDVKVDVPVGSKVANSGIKSDDVGSGGNSDLMKGNGDLDAKGINGQSHEEKRLCEQFKIFLCFDDVAGRSCHATLGHDQDAQAQARRVLMDTEVKVMKDQLIRAKAYLSFAADKVIIVGSHFWSYFFSNWIWMDRAPSFHHGYYTPRIPILLLAFFIQFYNLNICFFFLLYEL